MAAARDVDTTGFLTIAEVADRYKVTRRCLRFYDNRGLLSPRRLGTSRLYDSIQTARLEQILRGKKLGFTLGEIGRMFAGGDGAGDSAPAPTLNIASEQLEDQLVTLRRQRADLDSAIGDLRRSLSEMKARERANLAKHRFAKAN